MAGGSRRKRGSQKKNPRASRQPAKDHSLSHPQNDSPLSEELTALSSIFQEDFNLISEDSCTEFSITLHPHADGGRSNISAELHVRCLQGYPHKPPKLQVKCMEGLSHEELLPLHSLLIDQASAISREGRVMVYNLVEAAQEFLSEHIGSGLLQEFENDPEADIGVDKSQEVVLNSTTSTSQDITGPPVYGFVDLFKELGDEILWTGEVHALNQNGLEKRVGNAAMRNILPPENLNSHAFKKASQKLLLNDNVAEPELFKIVSDKLPVSGEEDSVGKAIQFSSVSELLEKVYNGLYFANHKNPISAEQSSASLTSSDSKLSLEQMCFSSQDRSEDSVRKDFLLAHLLRLVCCPRGPLPNAWPALALQIQKLHVIPQGVMDLLISQPQHFQLAFQGIFAGVIREATDGLISTKRFWSASEELLCGEDNGRTKSTSRYLSDFEELSMLGKGGFGYVALCKNNLDGRRYAVKKIRLTDKSQSLNNKILREVTTLSRLQHHHIVRYYQAWFETMAGITHVASEVETSGEWEETGSSFMPLGEKGPAFDYTEDNVVERTYLYIQMEYCPRTLREVLDFRTEALDEVTAWRYFRQIVEGLAYIHRQGIIHRDLTPNNIFFDVFDDIKIGDFGLAKFTSLEQPDREAFLSSDLHSSSLDGTGQVGTYLYTAPEVGQGWPLIDEKADMYSLGVILLELWHPFSTAMERFTILNELKNKGVPTSWALMYPQQAALVQNLMSANPADRPSAMHVLRNHLPPRMEDEALDDVLRTIQRAENSYVLDQIVSALFDEERISLIAQKIEREQLSYSRTEKTRDQILKIAKDIFTSHGAKGFNTSRLSLVDRQRRGQSVMMIDSAGRMLDLRSEMRTRFVCWVAANQVTSGKHFEISQVYRKAAGPNAPEEYYQGDFDIIGDSFGLAEAEVIKVVVDILSKCPLNESYEIHINHLSILEAIWSWSGVKKHERKDVAKLLSLAGCAPPQSSYRKSRWVHIRQQLVQGLQLQESVVDRLQTVERRWNGYPDMALSRLRGGLADSAQISTAIDELAALQSYLRVWSIGEHVHIDALMIPVEEYHRGIFFQVYLHKGGGLATSSAGMLLAVGGRYDHLVQEHWTNTMALSVPGAVGVSIALEKLILVAVSEGEQDSSGVEVLVCSKGGGGLLRERMEIVSELWDESIKAEFLHSPSPSLTEQYDYANEHGIKWLVMITEADLAHGNSVKVRNMETRKVEDVRREELVKYFTELAATMTNKKNRLLSSAK